MPASRMRSQQATSKRYKNEILLHQNLTLPSSASTYASAYRSLEVPAFYRPLNADSLASQSIAWVNMRLPAGLVCLSLSHVRL